MTPSLHERLFTIDTHLDTPTARLMRDDWDFGAEHTVAADGSQCDLPRMRRGGMDAAVFAVYSAQGARTSAGYAAAHERAVQVFDRTHAVIARLANACGLALTSAEALGLKQAGRCAIFLAIENSYPLGLDAANVARFHARGMRLLGLTHLLNNDLADASTDPRGPEWGGLSPLGRAVVAECNRLRIVVDASHASDAALRDLLAISRAPVILSHSGCRAVCDHPRNIGDDLLRALAANGGVIQINALPMAVVPMKDDGRSAATDAMLARVRDQVLTPELKAWMGAEWDRIDKRYPPPVVTMDDYVRHIEHAVKVAGIDHVGIGCDFDGGGGFSGLRSVADYPAITAALLARGWSEAALAKLWGANALRLLA